MDYEIEDLPKQKSSGGVIGLIVVLGYLGICGILFSLR
jgi:hypothetical protein